MPKSNINCLNNLRFLDNCFFFFLIHKTEWLVEGLLSVPETGDSVSNSFQLVEPNLQNPSR